MTLVLAGILGLVVGSFLNVVIWRVPRGESVVKPPSACPRCGHRLHAWENIPVLSWLWLRGKCSRCRKPIAARYPVIELVTAIAVVLVVLRFGVTWATLGYVYLACVAVALVMIDLDVKRLPDKIVMPTYLVVIAALFAESLSDGQFGSFWRALAGGAILFVFYFLALVLYPGGMGFGDVKLAGVLGLALAWIGWGALAIGAFGAFLLGGVYSIVLLLTRRAGRKSGIPFGPWMIAGAAIGIAVGEQIWDQYLALLA
ncbi:leader peptidase (prepilin peptidase) / N-methyltransferase [Micrococcales bacterium KH10]|nr:leader peptidase (prepilin peptidase) / N-methyltransferase [Micrococcales bacterium KH10]